MLNSFLYFIEHNPPNTTIELFCMTTMLLAFGYNPYSPLDHHPEPSYYMALYGLFFWLW